MLMDDVRWSYLVAGRCDGSTDYATPREPFTWTFPAHHQTDYVDWNGRDDDTEEFVLQSPTAAATTVAHLLRDFAGKSSVSRTLLCF